MSLVRLSILKYSLSCCGLKCVAKIIKTFENDGCCEEERGRAFVTFGAREKQLVAMPLKFHVLVLLTLFHS